MADLVERLGEYSPKMVFAGEFPMLTDTGTAGEAVNQWDIIMLDAATGNVSGPLQPELIQWWGLRPRQQLKMTRLCIT